MLLKDLEIGKSARITTVGGQGALRQHFLDMGVVPGAEIKLMKLAPMGDPMEFRIHGYELTLRVADAEKIEIEDISYSDSDAAGEEKLRSKNQRQSIRDLERAVYTTLKPTACLCRRVRQ